MQDGVQVVLSTVASLLSTFTLVQSGSEAHDAMARRNTAHSTAQHSTALQLVHSAVLHNKAQHKCSRIHRLSGLQQCPFQQCWLTLSKTKHGIGCN